MWFRRVAQAARPVVTPNEVVALQKESRESLSVTQPSRLCDTKKAAPLLGPPFKRGREAGSQEQLLWALLAEKAAFVESRVKPKKRIELICVRPLS